ncbi:phosphoribosyltransferase, partial [Bacillus tequilensis]|nr:phosphoribosyltransferase [Bacillus tequilensis]
DAGRQLGARLSERRWPNAVVLGLPRGGMPVAAAVADILGAPLDVLVVRKIGVPWHEELAVGALGEDGALVVNEDVARMAGISKSDLADAAARKAAEIERRVTMFRQGRPAADLTGLTAIVIDDGVATGATARAACGIARARGAASVVLAVPVAAPDALAGMPVDEAVCLYAPEDFMAVGMHYIDF